MFLGESWIIDISDFMAELHDISRDNDGVIDQSSVNKMVDEINCVFHTTARGLNMLSSTSELSGLKKPPRTSSVV